jgi:sugar-specific transcriptional regulator TrmB
VAEPDRIVTALVALGFSLNESRAYSALLLESPATGYEVGVRAQIPRSAVYGVLRRLVKSGAARSIAGSPERFAPAPAGICSRSCESASTRRPSSSKTRSAAST